MSETDSLELRRKADHMLDKRLASIEEELRGLRELVTQIVRIDERLASHIDLNNRIEVRQNKFDDTVKDIDKRVRDLETTGAKHGHTIGGVERFFWIVVASAIAIIGGLIKWGTK